MNDPISDVLRSVRLTGGVFLEARFTAPWSVLTQVTADFCRPALPSPAQVISYHYVLSGEMVCAIDGEPPLSVAAGEIVVLPRNDGHMLASGAGLKPMPAAGMVLAAMRDGFARIDHGGGGAETRMICGYLAGEEAFNPLIASLPRMMKLDIGEGASRAWIESSLRFAAHELAQGRPASSAVMARLSEVLFVEAVRHHAQTLGERQAGWLKGLSDSQVGRALALIHGDLAKPWSADELAREVALSRSAFMDRFTALVGMPPIRYATLWRLEAAKLHLRETGKTIARIAHAIGYESEEAFSRAFKREFGEPPARWRGRARMAPQAAV